MKRKRRQPYALHPDWTLVLLKRKVFDAFDHRMLGLGDVSRGSAGTDAICAIFDLAGFTAFCRQADPQLAVPDFMSRFLTWLFEEIKRTALDVSHDAERADDEVTLHVPLPFFAKFMGDGVMFLWNASGMEPWAATNIAIAVRKISLAYQRDLVPALAQELSYVPKQLRAGVARGRVYAVGHDKDYVGPCINIASRLQKIGSTVGWCVSTRGFPRKFIMHGNNAQQVVTKIVAVRGVGDEEAVYLFSEEFESLASSERALFQDPPSGVDSSDAAGAA